MKRNRLGLSTIKISPICLGTMRWGGHIEANEAHDLMDQAHDLGINFLDTAEIYPIVPVRDDKIGRTERIIGLWFEKTGRRDEWVVSTKQCGVGLDHVRKGAPITPNTIADAVEGSLRRMKTDYIDLFQFHWPNRASYAMRANWSYRPTGKKRAVIVQNIEDCLGALQREVEKGRILAYGLSNETAWGTMQWLEAAERVGGPRAVSIQNEYSMVCRLFDTDLSEMAAMERISLLATVPLAGGLLTGKYQDGNVPEGSRMKITPEMGGRRTERVFAAIDGFMSVARKHDLDVAEMAIAWILARPFADAAIVGINEPSHLEQAVRAEELALPDSILQEIDEMHRKHPMPF